MFEPFAGEMLPETTVVVPVTTKFAASVTNKPPPKPSTPEPTALFVKISALLIVIDALTAA